MLQGLGSSGKVVGRYGGQLTWLGDQSELVAVSRKQWEVCEGPTLVFGQCFSEETCCTSLSDLAFRWSFLLCGDQCPCRPEKLRVSQCTLPMVGSEPHDPGSGCWRSWAAHQSMQAANQGKQPPPPAVPVGVYIRV